MPAQTARHLIDRLAAARIPREAATRVLIPEWWDDECFSDRSLLPELEYRAARLLGVPLSVIRDPASPIEVVHPAGVHLRSTSGKDAERAPAVRFAIAIARAVVGNLADDLKLPDPLPIDPLDLHRSFASRGERITLRNLVAWLWKSGIPVIYLPRLPAPKFRGASFVIDGRPVVAVASRYRLHPEVAFTVAHEIGHHANGDTAAEGIIVDEDEDEPSGSISERERKADEYALALLFGDTAVPRLSGSSERALSEDAYERAGATIDPSQLIISWAREKGGAAHAAKRRMIESLPRKLRVHGDAAEVFGEIAVKHIAIESAPEDDRLLLGQIAGFCDANPTD